MNPADETLMARLRAGEPEAFATLYQRYRAIVFTFLLRLTRERALAEDLLQETFIRVYRARQSYHASGRFRTWLLTIARRLVIDHYRQERIPWEESPGAIKDAVGHERAEHGVEIRELLVRLEAALKELPPAQAEILLLSRVGGLDAAEIAHVTGSTPGAVRVALHRALQRLRSKLAE